MTEKKDFTKRAGQIYALGIQKGKSPDEMLELLNVSFNFLKGKEKEYEIESEDIIRVGQEYDTNCRKKIIVTSIISCFPFADTAMNPLTFALVKGKEL